MQKKIIRRSLSEDMRSYLSDMHPVLRRVYLARGVHDVAELTNELEKLQPYSSLLNIDQAVSCIAHTRMTQQSILIVGDFDADGATSTALAIRALRSFGAKQVNFLVPNRFSFGYGLTPELVAVAKSFQPSLIITVDNGIANHAGVAAAKAAGMQVVITDHHLAAPTLPDADAIVNPNQPEDKFPSKNLAGVGVIFYVMLALRRFLIEQGWFAQQAMREPNMSRLLDLVALGTVADLVPLDYNNRILVHQGLRRMRAKSCSPGVLALFEISGRDITKAMTSDIGFGVAARLNAAGRLDDMSLGIECLLCDDHQRAREIALTLNQLNAERRGIEQDMHHQAIETMTARYSKELPFGICLFDKAWHQGVIGILASRIKDRFYRPVIVCAPGKEGEIKGSARSIPNFHIRDTLAHIATMHPDLITKFGGHAMAAGLTIESSKFTQFAEIFNQVLAERMTEADLHQQVLTDGSLEQSYLNLATAEVLREAGPWGQRFPEPLFDDVFRIVDQRIVGDKHLKMVLSKDNGRVIDAIAFYVDLKQGPNHRCQSVIRISTNIMADVL